MEWLIQQKDIVTIVQHNRGEFRGKAIGRRSWGYFMNLAFKIAQGEFVLMISDDTILLPGSVARGLEAIRREGNRAGGAAFYFRNWPHEKEYYVQKTLGGRLMVNHGFFSRQALEKIGWADEESYRFYKADGDLSLRLWEAEYTIVDVPGAVVEHYVDPQEASRLENNEDGILKKIGMLITSAGPPSDFSPRTGKNGVGFPGSCTNCRKNIRLLGTRLPLKKSFLTVAFTEWMQIGLISIFITAFCGIFSLLLAVRYLEFHPYFFDAVSYSFYNIRLLELVRLDGAWLVAWKEISGNNRHPLRTVPLILFSPSLLGHPFGHVPFALLALLIFLCLLGWVTLQTTKSKPLSALVVLAAGCMPGIFQPWTGISAYWLDLVAALLMGAALLSLVRFGSGGGNGWLILCGILGASACLSRYVAAVYLAFAGIPCALILLFSRSRHDPKPLVFFCRSLIFWLFREDFSPGPLS